MAPTAAALLALSVIYRLTINLPDLPYSYDLRKPGSAGFVETASNISQAVDELLAPVRGEHRPVVFKFRYHKDIGSLAYLDIFCDEERDEIEDTILHALHKGQLGKFVVSTDGYQLHIIKEANDQCKVDEFQCSDGNCIPSSQRCDGNKDCVDGSDESKQFAECNHHQPVIYQTDKVLSAPRGGQVLLSAMIDLVPENHRVVWRKGEHILGDGELKLVQDDRVEIYKNENNYYLRIEDINDSDVGAYEISVDGFTSKAHFEVRLTADALPEQSEECPVGERACKSGHCIPVSQFCDRVSQCPDGDDELHCSPVECTSSEIRCHSDNVCIPASVACDGWSDCKDGSDEHGCHVKKNLTHKAHGHHKTNSRLTVTCEDGSTPEYSLHGSSYCWSNEICPTGTACIQGLCCNTGRNEKRSVGCAAGEFACQDGSCIPEEKKCDRQYDCRDGSDETACEYFLEVQRHHEALRNSASTTTSTPEHQTAPADGRHQQRGHEQHHHDDHHDQQQQRHDDERADTPESEEEPEYSRHEVEDPNAQCSDQEFRCPYLRETKCVHYDKLCDGTNDCGDGSDEVNCESGSREETGEESQALQGQCTANQFRCSNGRCIEKSLECNRKYDCDDGSDETSCDYFKEAMSRRNNENDLKNREEEVRKREEEARLRETEEHRREQEERRREQSEQDREQRAREQEDRIRQELERQRHQQVEEEEKKRREEHERHLDEQRRREHEERTREHHEHQQVHQQQRAFSNEVVFKEEYDDGEAGCSQHEFQCRTGECVDSRRVCDSRMDCLDGSDEANCGVERHAAIPPEQLHQQPATHRPHPQQHRDNDIDADGAQNVQITIYPTEAQVREGKDVSFDCRARTADNAVYPPVRWTKVGGPLPAHAQDSSGRLTINPTSLSDAGRYVCTTTHNGQTVEAHAFLNIQHYGPQELQGLMPSSGQCMADEKACGNNECVKSDYVCDGEPDCRDRSDEANCPALRSCEPNEHKCANQRCIQKMWLCDGDDDCGDNSDEQSCAAQKAGDMCKTTEFQCADRNQCVPSSFHCDGTNDCRDGSDEVGCVQPTVVEPPETNKQVPAGSTFSLTCKAVAVPEAYINWRLNWGPVCDPPRCLQSSEGGFGTLTVHNAQPLDQGAYTCEAINVKGRVLATPDCIVRIVNIPAPSPPPPAPARQPTCDPRGAVSTYPDQSGRCQCKPLVTGPNCNECRPGAFHLSEKSPQGCLKCFCFGVTDQCRSSSHQRTKERLMFAGDSEGVTLSDMEERDIDRNAQYEYFKTGYLTHSQPLSGSKFWRLPQRFLGDKVTAYGGKMEFEVEYSGSGSYSQEPMVVLKGNQLVLVHRVRNQDQVLQSDSPVRITVETYETSYEQLNGQPATREDLMMVLADLDAFMIRASHVSNQHSTSLGDVSWEIAVDRHTGEGLALEVEQCVCPPGYMGTSCEDCAPGYERSGQGPYLGTCVPIQQKAPVCTGAGVAAPQANYGGRCQCKNFATGPNCDQCPANSFYMAPTNPQGCIPCFCSGVTQSCQSSSYSRTKVEVDYGRGDRDQLALSTSDSRSPYTPQTPGYVSGSAIEFSSFHEANGQTLYWKMPEKFLGNKVTAYGGTLTFKFRFSGEGPTNRDANVILRGNDIDLRYTHRGSIHADRENTIEVKLFEDQWQRVDGQQATREHLLMALADLDALLIKATYIDDCAQSSLTYVSIEYAEPYGRGGRPALEVEQCQCPPGYVGTSCEDCAPGYSRTGGGLYLGLCEKCECHGHASQCDKEYGFCIDCQHNTEGDQCERCKPGFVGDARRGTPHDCQPAATRPPCNCNNHSPRGCDSFGRCLLCEHSTEGTHCERCKKGYYGDATKGSPYDCTPCPCPGASDCYLDAQGQVACRNCPAGFSGRLCNECAPGYTRSNKPSGRTCEPIGSVTNQERTYVPSPDAVGRPPQPVIDPPHQTVMEGEPASFRCWVPGIPDCQITFHKEYIGGPLPHGVYQTGNALKIPRTQLHDAGNYICTAINQHGIGKSPNARLDVIRPVQKPKVDPMEQTVDEGEPARFRCWVPGQPDAQLKWHRAGHQPLPSGVQEQQGILHIPRTSQNEIGQYVCTATDPRDNRQQDSDPVTLNLKPREPPSAGPQVDPPEQTVNEGDPAQFRCWVPGNPQAQINWARADGQSLPEGTLVRDGYLRISNAKMSDAGQFICTATDPRTGGEQPAPPATLNVKQGAPMQPQVDPPEQTVDEGSPSRVRCWVPGNPRAQIRWTKPARAPLQQGAHEQGGHLSISRTQKSDAGEYICTAYDPQTRQQAEVPAKINVRADEQPPTARVEPRVWNGQPGDRHQFRCITTGSPTPKITWTGPNGTPLPHDVTALEPNILDFANGRSELNGDYTCTATNPIGEASDHGSVNIGPTLTIKTTPAGHKLILTVGEPLQVKCEAFGDPEPEVEWLHDPGPERGDLPDDFKPVTISEQFIRHPSIGLGNAGLYTCKGSNSHATATKDIYIEVVEPSRVATVSILGGSSQTFDEGAPSELICTATGSSLVDRLEWIKVDDQLPTDVEEHNEPGLLHFPNFKKSYAGEYECRGYRNNELIASTAVSVHASGQEPDEPVVEIEPPRVRIVAQGDSIVLKCSVEGAKSGEHFDWALLRGGNIVRKLGNEATLNIKSADPSNDFGVYRCNVEDDNGIVIGSAYTAVTVGYAEKSNAQVMKFDEKSDASFVCPVYSVPGSKVEWSRQDGDLPTNAIPNGNKIEIKDFDEASSGLYVCKVTFENIEAEGYVHAQIFVPDTIIQVLLEVSSENVNVGDRAWFDCKVTGDPSAQITWVKEGGDSLPENSQVTGGRLLFTEVKEENAGTYRCRAKTKAGPLETRSVLNVGNAKRKRKHTTRRGRHANRHRRRHAPEPTNKSLFGSWFSTN